MKWDVHVTPTQGSRQSCTHRMRVLLIIAALVAVGWTASISVEDVEFQDWKVEFGRSYGSEKEESQRKATWLANRKLILEHNKLADKGIKSYRLGLNKFADMDNEEYRQVVLGGCLGAFNMTSTSSEDTLFPQTESGKLPNTVDWVKEGYVTPVKDQQQCGSCWAFSATGALEGQLFKSVQRLVPLSEQQLVDCSRPFKNGGCNGGWMNQAFDYIKSSGGLQAADSYPYEAMDGACRFDPAKAIIGCSGYKNIPQGNEKRLQEAVASAGPISVAIDASQYTFQHYKSGVYDEPYCSETLTHAVLIVGYGTEKKNKYWLVKNSWSTAWGDNGYIKMSRNKRNQCGIASVASYPLIIR